jgi:ABC-type transporter Mla maintaining outer membrane lipid asymmetry permease subunit MlaE
MSLIKRFVATIVWVPLMAVVILMAMLSGLLVGATALMIPAVRWLARVGDED